MAFYIGGDNLKTHKNITLIEIAALLQEIAEVKARPFNDISKKKIIQALEVIEQYQKERL
jgi:hypothetical protein